MSKCRGQEVGRNNWKEATDIGLSGELVGEWEDYILQIKMLGITISVGKDRIMWC